MFKERQTVKWAVMFTPHDLESPEGRGTTFKKHSGTVLWSTGGKQSQSTHVLLLVTRLTAVGLCLH